MWLTKRTKLLKKKCLLHNFVTLTFVSFFVTFMLIITYKSPGIVDEELLEWERMVCSNSTTNPHRRGDASSDSKYLVTWYNINPYIRWRPKAWRRGFQPCKYNNCQMSLCKQTTEESHAVIFDGRRVPEKYELKRPPGQVWVFAEDETPYTYDLDGGHWKSEFWRHAFNWSMTYDRLTTDIYLTFGEIRKKATPDRRNFLQIAKNKTRGALLISSNCLTNSKRLEYVKELQKYVDVDILGTCGRKWECGRRWIHDDCFGILNHTYKFYLAFENALCRGYRTEKFFENFNYDIVLVERGGVSSGDRIQPEDVYISTSDFPDAKSLGKYLNRLSDNIEEYAALLERKSQYYSADFHETYQTALCTLCEKLNFLEDNRREIRDLEKDVRAVNPCLDPTDVKQESLLSSFWKYLINSFL